MNKRRFGLSVGLALVMALSAVGGLQPAAAGSVTARPEVSQPQQAHSPGAPMVPPGVGGTIVLKGGLPAVSGDLTSVVPARRA